MEPDACTKEVPGGFHLYASCGGMGLELECVSGDSHAPAADDGAPAVDGTEAAEELSG